METRSSPSTQMFRFSSHITRNHRPLVVVVSLFLKLYVIGGDEFYLAPMPIRQAQGMQQIIDDINRVAVDEIIFNGVDGKYTPITNVYAYDERLLLSFTLLYDFEQLEYFLAFGLFNIVKNEGIKKQQYHSTKINHDIAIKIDLCINHIIDMTCTKTSRYYVFDEGVNFVFDNRTNSGYCSNVTSEGVLGGFLKCWLDFNNEIFVNKISIGNALKGFEIPLKKIDELVRREMKQGKTIHMPPLIDRAFLGRLSDTEGLDLSFIKRLGK